MAAATITEPEWRNELEAARAWTLIHSDGPAAALAAAEELCTRTEGRALEWASLVAAYSLGRAGRLLAAEEATRRARTATEGRVREADDDRMETARFLALSEALLVAGRLGDADVASQAEYEAAVGRVAIDTQACAALQLAKVRLGQGLVASAVHYAREAVTLNRHLIRRTYLRESLVVVALAEAMLGRRQEAAAALTEIDALDLPRSWMSAVDLVIARAWSAVASRDLPSGRGLLGEAAELAAAVGDTNRVCTALHDLARLGAAGEVAGRLAALVSDVEGDLAAARSAHANALAERDAVGLREASHAFETLGAVLLAAEASADAAVALRRRGAGREAMAQQQRSSALAQRCEGAVTPALVAVGSRALLTPAERETALLAVDGRSNREIADQLGLSVRTVENRLWRIYEKLNVSGRAQLAAALED